MPNTTSSTGEGKYALPTSVYDAAKDTVLIYLPAAGTLYFTLATIWGLPAAEQVVGTFAAVAVFLGLTLKISTVSFNKSSKSTDGSLIIDQSDPTKDKYLLDVTTPLEAVADSDKITLKVDNQSSHGGMDQRLITPSSQ